MESASAANGRHAAVSTFIIEDSIDVQADHMDELHRRVSCEWKQLCSLIKKYDDKLRSQGGLNYGQYDLHHSMKRVIYGSNCIDRAGADFETTYRIYDDIFIDHNIIPDILPKKNAYHDRIIDHLSTNSRPSSDEKVQEAYLETVHHVYAYKYLSNVLIHKNKPLSETIIKEAHRILVKGISRQGDTSLNENAEEYRKIRAFKACPTDQNAVIELLEPDHIPRYMAMFVEDFNSELDFAKTSEDGNYLELAARFCAKLINIQPFTEANDRLGRLVLQILMRKGTKTVIPLADEPGPDRLDYLGIVWRMVGVFRAEKRTWTSDTSHFELASFLAHRASIEMETLIEELEGSWGSQVVMKY